MHVYGRFTCMLVCWYITFNINGMVAWRGVAFNMQVVNGRQTGFILHYVILHGNLHGFF